MSDKRRFHLLSLSVPAALCLCVLLCISTAQAADKYWNTTVTGGDWDNASNWSPTGEPIDGDNVFLLQSDSLSRSVRYRTSDSDLSLNILRIDATGDGNMNLLQGYYENENLSAGVEQVGYDGKGFFEQSGGQNTVGNWLVLGTYSTSSGAYRLKETGTLSAGYENVGNYGIGTFLHSGGQNTLSENLYLGYNYSGKGTYNLSGDGSLSAKYECIGERGTGTFNHSGGQNTLSGNLVLGDYVAASGTYNLSGSGTLSAAGEYIGEYGTGTFTQSGGENTVNHAHIAAEPGSSGTYNLQGGTLTAGTIQLNEGGTFSRTGGNLNYTAFNQDGGTVNGILSNYGTFNYTGGTFAGRLEQWGTFIRAGDFTAGDGIVNYADMTISPGYNLYADGYGLENNGILTLAGGTLGGNGPMNNYSLLTGAGTIAGSGGFSNYGQFSQNGGHVTLGNTGANANYGNMELAAGYQMRLTGGDLANYGALNLNGAILTGTASLENELGGAISGRGLVSGRVDNTGGVVSSYGGALTLVNLGTQSGTLVAGNGSTLNILNDFTNAGALHLEGASASLGGGVVITNTGTIQGRGTLGNHVRNTGIIDAVGGSLNLNGGVQNLSGGLMSASPDNKILVTNGMSANDGIISLAGGTYDNNNHALTNRGQISGHGVLRSGGLMNESSMIFSGGPSMVNGDVTNADGGRVEVAYSPAVFSGNVINHGLFKTTDSTVTFAGTYTEHGVYFSDPSHNYFTDLIVGADGALRGGEGDYWYVNGNFVNGSTMYDTWETVNAYLGFITGTDDAYHDFYLAGQDSGPSMDGYHDNFAWGSLNITDQSLSLYDGNTATLGGAQYVRALLGAAIGADEVIQNIQGADGLNIYYLASLTENAYLGGWDYALDGGGWLMAVTEQAPVPEPATMLLLGSGLIGLAAASRRKFKRTRSIV